MFKQNPNDALVSPHSSPRPKYHNTARCFRRAPETIKIIPSPDQTIITDRTLAHQQYESNGAFLFMCIYAKHCWCYPVVGQTSTKFKIWANTQICMYRALCLSCVRCIIGTVWVALVLVLVLVLVVAVAAAAAASAAVAASLPCSLGKKRTS